ncbi:hypothetical protein [Luteolibacter soli]
MITKIHGLLDNKIKTQWIAAAILCILTASCKAQETKEEKKQTDIPAPKFVTRIIEAQLGLDSKSQKRTITPNKGVLLPNLTGNKPRLLAEWIVDQANTAYDSELNKSGTWSSLQGLTEEHAEPDIIHDEANHQPPKLSDEDKKLWSQMVEAEGLVQKAKHELEALPDGDSKRPLFQARLTSAKDKLAVLLLANHDIAQLFTNRTTNEPEVTTLSPTKVVDTYPPVNEWEKINTWTSIKFGGEAALVDLKNVENTSEESVDSVTSISMEIAQVSLTRPGFSIEKLKEAVNSQPNFKGRYIISDIIIARNIRILVSNEEKIKEALKSNSSQLAIDPIVVSGPYSPFFAEEKAFTPSWEGETLVINPIQIIAFLCQKIN